MLYELSTPHLAKGHLKQVPEEWCPPYSGHHLYYASRRQPTPAFAFLVDVAVKRWQDFTGETGKLQTSGQSFDEIVSKTKDSCITQLARCRGDMSAA